MNGSDMVRRVRQKGSESKGKNKANIESSENLGGGCSILDRKYEVDWTTLPDDTVIQLFSCLNYRDRASLASTCQTLRLLASSPCLWEALDLRSHKFDNAVAVSLSSRCKFLQTLRFRGAEAANAIIGLQARGLREVSGDFCQDITDSVLSVVAARHEMLESLQLGPDACEKISSDAIKVVTFCCPMLKRLRLSGIQDVSGDAINALGKNCRGLVEVAFMDCEHVDEGALQSLSSVRFLSISGTRNLKWGSASQILSELPNLVGLDVSRTDINFSSGTRLLSSSQNLKVLLALNCPVFEAEVDNNILYNYKGKILISLFSDIFKVVASFLSWTPDNVRGLFSYSRNVKKGDRSMGVIVSWIEWVLSHVLLRIAESNPKEFNDFWLKQGTALLLSLMQSSQEDIQERAARAVATFVVTDDEEAIVDCQRTEAVMRDGGLILLLDLARSCQEEVQSEAAKAIANLSVDSKVAKAVAEVGGISILANLARSMNRLVAEEAAGGLWNLSVGEEHKGAIVESGGIKALVDLIFKWPSGGDGVLVCILHERAAGALANLAADDKCSLEVAATGGIHALVMLARTCKFEGVQEQAARALANLAAHGDNNSNNASVGKEAGALEVLVQLTCSQHEGVRQEAAGALWNLSFDDKNREAIAAAGGVQALVALAESCSTSSKGLQERAAGALWGLSVSEANSIAIGQEGGVAPLIALARSDVEDVHETAAGALWNLAFNSGNALRIVENEGVGALAHLCSSSTSRMARFMAALALSYMFDGRMDEFAYVGPSSGGTSNLDGVRRMALKHIQAFVHSFYDQPGFCTAVSLASPSALTQVAESARIPEAGHLRCSEAEIGRFVVMLRNHSAVLKSCAAFALLQFTMPGGRHAIHHTCLLQNVRGSRVLRSAAASSQAPLEVKLFARIVLRNLEHHTESLV